MVANFLKKSANVFSLKQTNILSAAVVIMGTVLLSAMLGLLRVRLLSSYFGDTRTLDIYWAAFRLPDMLFQLLVMGAVSSAFIPVFSSYLSKDKNDEAFYIANTVINFSIIFFLIAAAFIYIFTGGFCRLLAPGFSPEQINLMVKLTRIMLIGQVFFIVGNFFTAMLQSFHRFLLPALSPIIYNVGIIAGTVLLSPYVGIYGPTYGVVIGTVLFLIIQLPLTRALGWKYKPVLTFKHPGVIEIGKLMLPRTLSLGVSQIEYNTDLMIASLFAAGHYTVFNFALFLISLPVRLFGATIGQASLPTLSRTFAQENREEFKNTLTAGISQIMYLVLPASIILLVLRIPLVRLAFGSSSFSWDATLLTGKVVAFLTIAIVAQSLTQLLVRGFYALHDTKTPFIISIISVLLNVVISVTFGLFLKFGVVGLALSTSFSSLVNTVLLMCLLIKRLGRLNESFVISAGKTIFATGIMGIVLYLFMRVLDLFVFDTTRTLNLILLTVVTTCLGVISYLFVSRIIKIREADTYLEILKKMGKWKQIILKNEELVDTTPTASQTQPTA